MTYRFVLKKDYTLDSLMLHFITILSMIWNNSKNESPYSLIIILHIRTIFSFLPNHTG